MDLLADMYENAHKSKPDSEEILNSLFMAYVRLGQCKKQQQVHLNVLLVKLAVNKPKSEQDLYLYCAAKQDLWKITYFAVIAKSLVLMSG